MRHTAAIVEDHPDYRSVLEEVIAGSDAFMVTQAFASGEEVLAALHTTAPPDLMLIDIRLPGISGITLIRKIKAIHPTVLYLVCTTHQDDETVFDALKAGASGYLLKDSLPGEILSALADLANGGAPMSPYIARRVVSAFHEKGGPKPEPVLTSREHEILGLLARGMGYGEIADTLFISVETVKTHIRNIYAKLHVRNKVEAILKYREL